VAAGDCEEQVSLAAAALCSAVYCHKVLLVYCHAADLIFTTLRLPSVESCKRNCEQSDSVELLVKALLVLTVAVATRASAVA
jgi:hypothetical protein